MARILSPLDITGIVLSKSPTCLAFLRRLAIGGNSTSLVQTRSKTLGRRTDRGVLVRLLEDKPKFGPKYAIFRTERGRMRNYWYPRQEAEYLTPERLEALGLTKADIGERDTTFALYAAGQADADAGQGNAQAAEPTPLVVENLSPKEALILVDTMVPKTLTFFGKLIHTPPTTTPAVEGPRLKSPLIAEPAPAASQQPSSESGSRAIYGSVSTVDIANEMRRFMAEDVKASTVALGPENIRFVTLDAGTDRVKTTGRFEIHVIMPNDTAEPVRKIIEVVPEERSRTYSEKAAAAVAEVS